ncbi:cytidine deaminase-like protein [Crucibulum laeve]|uniref:Cytidine deaminase-like protein n=1 Tax=Crucibulum laeve TaxID=68775 RepID=A0A5C3MAN4_9AGAR|nr:cytidine deaminase-like protein [Crucibulum laeve]
MSSSPTIEKDLEYLHLAIREAEKCEPTPTAFCVGCILTSTPPGYSTAIISTGYSRELAGNTHAEANALSKAKVLSTEDLVELFPGLPSPNVDNILAHADVYTTMEPCSVRSSGLAPCANALIAAKVKRCFIGVGEPDDFVKCEGAQLLKDAGIEVIWLKGFEEECLRIAREGHDPRT